MPERSFNRYGPHRREMRSGCRLLLGGLIAAALIVLSIPAWGGTGALLDLALMPANLVFVLAGLITLFLIGWALHWRFLLLQIRILIQSADHLSISLQLVTNSGKVLYENEAARARCALLRQSKPHASLIDTVRRFVSDDTSKQRFDDLYASLSDDPYRVRSVDLSLTLPDKGETWWRVTMMPLRRYPRYIFWSVEDIGEKRHLEALAAQERRHFTTLVQNAPIGFYTADIGGNLTFMNDTLANWLGVTGDAGTWPGTTIADWIADPPIDPSIPYSVFADQRSSGEVTLRRADGRYLRCFIRQELSPAGPGEELSMRAVIYDLGREHALQTALARSEQRFHNVFEDSPIGIVSTKANGDILDCNPAFRRMVAATQYCTGISLRTLVREDDRASLDLYLSETGQGKTTLPVTVHWEGSDNVATIYAVRQGTNNDATLICHFIDVTEQKKLESRFVQSQKMQAIGQLAGGVAHDFNNLLTAMIGFCDLLLQRHRPGDPSFGDIMQIKQNANRAANLVRQLLAFSRQQTLQPRVFNITDILSELSHLLRRLIGETIELKMIHGRDLPLVKADPGQLEQVIVNLAVNARDAMPQGGVLTIETGTVTYDAPQQRNGETIPAGTYASIQVIDTGTGIPADIMARIFEPFFSTKEIGAGTGLGLATVYGILQQTGGFIFVESEAGKGARFTILLPRHVAAGTGTGMRDIVPEAAAGDLTGQGTILLAEDEDAVRIFSARALRNKGYRVIEARNGESAIEQFNAVKDEVDLLISDVVMPQMDGPTLLRHLRTIRPGLRALFMSGYAEDSIRQQLVTDERTQFLSKPFTLKQLATKVKDLLSVSETV